MHIPILPSATIKLSTRCEQFYQTIAKAANDKSTFWHNKKAVYTESVVTLSTLIEDAKMLKEVTEMIKDKLKNILG